MKIDINIKRKHLEITHLKVTENLHFDERCVSHRRMTKNNHNTPTGRDCHGIVCLLLKDTT